MAQQTICNWCGGVITQADEEGSISIHKEMGYGSEFEGVRLGFDLCPTCTDAFIKGTETKCAVSMLTYSRKTELL